MLELSNGHKSKNMATLCKKLIISRA
uniref:Uncharacterized protein n=1 Tax=Anguilla anguilla TaxID=7936 RepID=A0A0E9P629_ANGAN